MNPKIRRSFVSYCPSSPSPTSPETIKIHVSCQDLIVDSSVSQAVSISLYTQNNFIYTLNSETEKQILSNYRLDFSSPFSLPFCFEEKQRLKFVVKVYRSYEDAVILAEAYTSLSEITGGRDQVLTLELTSKSQNTNGIGKLIATVDKTSHIHSLVKMGVQAHSLFKEKKGQIKPSFLNLTFRLLDTVTQDIVYESEATEKESPNWNGFEMDFSKLCHSEYYRPLKLQVLNIGVIIGETCFTIHDLLNTKGHDFPTHLLAPNTKAFAGNITIYNFRFVEKPHFLDYVQGGLQVNLLLGIDYSTPQGNTVSWKSTEYQNAITGVFETLINYNKHKKVKMFGFGGTPISSEVFNCYSSPQCFSLTDCLDRVCITELQSMIDTYEKSVKEIQPQSKSYLEPLACEAIRLAKSLKNTGTNEYVVLVVLASERCCDIQEFTNAALKALELPLSIMVIDMTNDNFSKMELFQKAFSFEKNTERDMVNYVRITDVQYNSEKLAQCALKKIPNQIVEYMFERQNILPQPSKNSRRSSKEDQNTGLCIFDFSELEIGDEHYNDGKDMNISSFRSRHVSISTPFSKSTTEESLTFKKRLSEDEEDEEDDECQSRRILSFKRNSQRLNTFRWSQKEISEPTSTKNKTSRASIFGHV